METLVEKIAAYASVLSYDDLPAVVIHQTKRTIIDTLGCAFGGYASEPAVIARDMAGLVNSVRPATLFYCGHQTSMDLAAFANDAMIRYLDFNDGYIGMGGGHPSDMLAALFAAAEVAQADGRALIVATVLAYEIYTRIADVWNNKASGIDHVTIGGIATAVGAARLLGLTQAQIGEAININLAGHIALNQTRVGNLSQWKGCAFANASRNALFSVQLAARGMTGPSPIFEGRNGFFKVVSGEPFELGPFGGADRPFGIMKANLKQFPVCNDAQTVVPAALEARNLVQNMNDVSEIHIRVRQKGLNVMADEPAKWRPSNPETADHSIPYTAGVALMFGAIDRSYFSQAYLHNEKLLELISRIKCGVSEEANRLEKEMKLCELDLVMRSGERKSVRVEHWRGHWRNPMTDAEVEAKCRNLIGDMLPGSQIDGLLDQLWKLENLARVASLVQMTIKAH